MTTTAKWVADLMEGMISPVDGLLSSRATVINTEYLSENIKRVRFRGNFSRMDFQIGYAVVMRVGPTDFRNYTVSQYEVGTIEIIYHLHGDAPGSNFAVHLKNGDEVLISMPRGTKQYKPEVKQQLIFGDETSLGLACAFHPLLKMNQHEYQFYFELEEANKDVPHLLELENYQVFTKGAIFKDRQRIGDLPVFKNRNWQAANFILTGNVTSVQNFRRTLKEDNRKGQIFHKGFWLEEKTGL